MANYTIACEELKAEDFCLGIFNAAGDRIVAWIADPVDLELGSATHRRLTRWLAGWQDAGG